MSEKVAPLVEGDTKIAIQTQQLGTGDAVNAGRRRHSRRPTARSPRVRSSFFRAIARLSLLKPFRPLSPSAKRRARPWSCSPCIWATTGLGMAASFARAKLWSASLSRKTPTPEEAAIAECNSGFYCFDAPAPFRCAFARFERQRSGRVLPYRRAGNLSRHDGRAGARASNRRRRRGYGRELSRAARPGYARHAASHQQSPHDGRR